MSAGWERPLLAAIFAVGIGFRLMQYLGMRSFWMDEAFAASKYLGHSFAELLHPSVFGGVAPGFYILERAAALTLGVNELSLRLVPLLAGIASLFLFHALARKTLSPKAALLALAFFAVSPFLVYYSSEAKRYATDVAASLVVLLLAVDLHARGATPRRVALFAGAGVVAGFFATTTVMMLAGTTLGLLLAFRVAGDRRSVRPVLALAGVGVLLLGVAVVFVLGSAGKTGTSFWESGFMPLPPRSLSDLGWFPDTFMQLFRDPLGALDDDAVRLAFYQPAAGMLAFTAGVAWLWSTRRGLLFVLLGPVAVALLLSGLRVYPFGAVWVTGGRSVLYLAPVFFLLMAEGAEQLHRALGPSLRAVAVAVLLLLLVPPLVEDVRWIPYGRAEMRPVVEYVARQRAPGDVVHVHYDAAPIFAMYAGRFGFRQGSYAVGECSRFSPERYLMELSRYQGQPRVWVLFGAGVGAHRFGEKKFVLEYLDQVGVKLDTRVAKGASAYLYDLSRAPAGEGYRVQIPEIPPDVNEGCGVWKGE